MALFAVSIKVVDFDEVFGAPPETASVEIARAQVSTVGDLFISTRPITVHLTAGTGSVQLEGGDVYQVLFRGVPGLGSPFFIAMPPAATTAAELWTNHQIDPATIAPLPQYPTVAATLASLRNDLNALATEVGDLPDPVTGTPVDDLPDLTILFENGIH